MSVGHRPTLDEVLALDHRWYHTIDLAPGVATPGWIDLRGVVDRAALPSELQGRRALDVGTYDGFWAFELERRGADVVAIDADESPPPDTPPLQRAKLAGGPVHPPGRGFELLRAYFDSTVHRRALNVYDLSPDRIGGAVDVAFIGALLLHLRDPVRALERVRECLTPGGRLVLFESVDAKLSKREEPLAHYMAHETLWTWWHPNTACVRAWAATAGFGDVRQLGTVKVRDGYRQVQTMATVHATA